MRPDLASAAVQVADLKPQGPLHQTVTQSGPNELQSLLPIMFRRQYLNELFPDLSVEANYEEEPDHHQLTVPRDEFLKETCPVSLTATVSRSVSLVTTRKILSKSTTLCTLVASNTRPSEPFLEQTSLSCAWLPCLIQIVILCSSHTCKTACLHHRPSVSKVDTTGFMVISIWKTE